MKKLKKYKKVLIWGGIALYLIVMLSFVSYSRKSKQCNDIEVIISDSSKNKFVEKNDILEMVYNKNDKLIGYSIDSINIDQLEQKINQHPSVKEADVYKTIFGILRIELTQREPIVRVINDKNEGYYIDNDGAIMPLSNQYSAHVIVASGNIRESFKLKKSVKLPLEVNTNKCLLCEIYQLVKFINKDVFLASLLEQIYVDDKGEFELIPRVGSIIIQFGDMNDMDEKFRKIKAFYLHGFKKTGWNKYRFVNVKYKNQIVCTKRDE